MSEPIDPFSDPQAVARYAEGPPRIVPGYDGLIRMATVLLAERVPRDGRVLVLGAGGGLELKAFSQTSPGWKFCGVDPSAEMLKLAGLTLGPLAERVSLIQGYIDDAPVEQFDGASCVLTMHFVSLEERLHAAVQIRRRLKPGAPFVVAHFSIPPSERELWLSRYAAFMVASGTDPEIAANAGKTVATRVNILAPEEDELVLREAGFSSVSLFYVGFTFRGWVGYA